MHGRRVLAAAAAAGLLVSLFAPWYRETVVASGITGLRTLTLTRSGWQAFSTTELLIVVVAILTLLVVIGMPSDVPEDGAPNRLRRSGAVVAALGAIAFAVLLARLTTAPGTTRHALDETMVAIRWGILLALACSAALTAAGLRLIRAQRQPARPPRAQRQPARPPRAEREPRPERLRRGRGGGGGPPRGAPPPPPPPRPGLTARARRPHAPTVGLRPRWFRTGGLIGHGRHAAPTDPSGTSRRPAGSTSLTDPRGLLRRLTAAERCTPAWPAL